MSRKKVSLHTYDFVTFGMNNTVGIVTKIIKGKINVIQMETFNTTTKDWVTLWCMPSQVKFINDVKIKGEWK